MSSFGNIGRTFSPTRSTPHGTPQNRTFNGGLHTSTPNKESSARRCLPLLENPSRQQDVCPASNCGRLRYIGTAPVDLVTMGHGDPPPRYAYMENGLESMPMVSGSPRYQVIPAGQKRNGYQSVESAFIARTAVVSKNVLLICAEQGNETMIQSYFILLRFHRCHRRTATRTQPWLAVWRRTIEETRRSCWSWLEF